MEGGGRKRQCAVRSSVRSTIRSAIRRTIHRAARHPGRRSLVTCGLLSIPLPTVPTRARRGVEGTTFV